MTLQPPRLNTCVLSLLSGLLLGPALAWATHPVEKTPGAGMAKPQQQCEMLDPGHCLFPYPSDFFTRRDPATATGRRLDFPLEAMPVNRFGQQVDPLAWNRRDGFSAGTMLVVHLPQVDLKASDAPQITDPFRALKDDSPMVLMDADNGTRYPLWAERDTNTTDPAAQALIMRPAVLLPEGRRYIAALRNLRDSAGHPVAPGVVFASYRDATPPPPGIDAAAFETRRTSMATIFQDLERNGIPRGELHLAWDFTVASAASTTAPLVHMRDEALALLAGGAPSFSIDRRTEIADGNHTGLRIEGRIRVPSYLKRPEPEIGLGRAINTFGDHALDFYLHTRHNPGILPDQALFDRIDELFTLVGEQHLPADHFTYPSATSAYPTRPANNWLHARFECLIPRVRNDPDTPRPNAVLLGHGLLYTRHDVRDDNVRRISFDHNMMYCATDFLGLSQGDIPNTILVLADIGLFPSKVDQLEQGALDFLYLARAMAHPQGFAAHAAFEDDAKKPLFDNTAVYYDGNSQGGIMGGLLLALSPDLQRGVLGATGMNYSTLLRRSTDFTPMNAVMQYAYPNPLDQTLLMALIQTLWDQAETNGYLTHIRTAPLPGMKPKDVLLHVAFGDHQVTNWSAWVEARSLGIPMNWPVTAPERNYPQTPFAGITRIGDASGPDDGQKVVQYPVHGSAMIVWETGPVRQASDGKITGTEAPLTANLPVTAGEDPHYHPRNDPEARRQKAHFLRTGEIIDVCHGEVCWSQGSANPD